MKKWYKLTALLLAALFLLAVVPAGDGGGLPQARALTQADIDALKDQANDLKSKRREVEKQLASLKDDRSSALQRIDLLNQQIALTEQEIANTESKISGYEVLLSQTAYELEENKKQEEEQYALFCERARVMEEAGTVSYWAVLFKAESFSDLLGRLADIQEVINYDQGVLDDLRRIRAEIEEKQAYQEELKAEAEAAKADLEEQKGSLESQRTEVNNLVAEIEANMAEYQDIWAQIEADEKAVEADIKRKSDELARQQAAANGGATTPSVGGYIWPVTTSRKINSPMGSRNTGIPGASTNHKGVDIGGVFYSSKVLATKAGTVITSKRSSSYGEYVVIYHGPGNTTLYAHMSQRMVSEGDVVVQGQVIGITGSTGIANGPHLHYEITENGARVNPLNYLPGWIKNW